MGGKSIYTAGKLRVIRPVNPLPVDLQVRAERRAIGEPQHLRASFVRGAAACHAGHEIAPAANEYGHAFRRGFRWMAATREGEK